MGKSDTNIAAEFFKLELLLVQTADDAVTCVKTLKNNLAKYDTHHGLHCVNTSKSFMRSHLRLVKDAASDLRLAAAQIAKCKFLSEWEIAAAHNNMKTTSEAIGSLKKAARVYDEMNGKPKGITRFIDNVLVGKEVMHSNAGSTLANADTVEAVVKSTLRANFSGFSALQHQISTAEKSLFPSLAERAKDVVVDVVSRLKGDSSPSLANTRSFSI